MVSNWQVTPKPIVMGACWGDLLLWFICRWEKKGNIPKVLQGFRNLQKGHRGYTWAHYLHLSGECQQERMSFRCCTGGKLREIYGCIHIGSYKVPWKNIWDTAFLHAGSFFLSFDSLGHIEQLWIADIQLKFYDALSRCVVLAECHLTTLLNLWEKKCQLCCSERLEPAPVHAPQEFSLPSGEIGKEDYSHKTELGGGGLLAQLQFLCSKLENLGAGQCFLLLRAANLIPVARIKCETLIKLFC